jgi:hypothetical protein
MGWKFWKKDEPPLESTPKSPRPSKPRDLPSAVGRILVLEMRQNPDWVWALRCVMQARGSDENLFDLRVFDPKQAYERSVEIRNYKSLDDYADLILYAGIYDKKQNRFQMMRDAA